MSEIDEKLVEEAAQSSSTATDVPKKLPDDPATKPPPDTGNTAQSFNAEYAAGYDQGYGDGFYKGMDAAVLLSAIEAINTLRQLTYGNYAKATRWTLSKFSDELAKLSNELLDHCKFHGGLQMAMQLSMKEMLENATADWHELPYEFEGAIEDMFPDKPEDWMD